MTKISNRQVINIAVNLTLNSNNNQNICFNLRFPPDEVIVRQITYVSGGDAIDFICQIYSNLVDDLILANFPVFNDDSGANPPNSFTNNLNTHFRMYRKFQNGSVNFQIQYVPVNPTIAGLAGPLVDEKVVGTVNLALEFVQYEE